MLNALKKGIYLNGILIVFMIVIINPLIMQKIKESFHEVIAGQPVKQHYVYVSIVTVSLSVVVGLFMVYFKIGH